MPGPARGWSKDYCGTPLPLEGAGKKKPAPKTAGKAGKWQPFPGAAFFRDKPHSRIVTAMGKRLAAQGCGKYQHGPGPQWTDKDRASYRCWQAKLGYTGKDADGWPGKASWAKLRVPKVA